MKKIAVSNDEDLVRVKAMLESRERTKEEVNSFFNNARQARKTALGTMEKLLVQTPAAQSQQPNLQKEAAAMLEAHKTAKEEVVGTHINEFFEKRAYLTEAQRRYPELLKVGATDTVPQKAPMKKLPGQIPARSQLAGGQV